jgi:hypothetical protein
MQLDDFQKAWAAHGAALERSLAIDERLLREVLLRKVRFALAPYALRRALEVAVGVGALLLALPVLVAHVAEPLYLVVAGLFCAGSVATTAVTAWLLVSVLRLDHARPVTAIQRELEHVRLVEYHALKWSLLGGTVLWLPAALVLFEAVSGVPALARVHFGWLVANLVFGLVLLALGHAWARTHLERSDLAPWARRLVDTLTGRALRSAAEHLADVARFERDETPRSTEASRS